MQKELKEAFRLYDKEGKDGFVHPIPNKAFEKQIINLFGCLLTWFLDIINNREKRRYLSAVIKWNNLGKPFTPSWIKAKHKYC